MRTPVIRRRSAMIALAAACVFLAHRAGAQDMDHSAMPMHDMPPSVADTDRGESRPATPQISRDPIPVPSDADRIAARPPSAHMHDMHDDRVQSYVLLDRLEIADADDRTSSAWEGRAWIGTDRDRLWLRSEGERADGALESADLELLYGRSVSPWWDVVAGLRHDFKPGMSQDFASIGVIGLSPYKFEVEATAYLGESGQTAVRLEIEYELLLTNRLVLQPRIEVDAYGRNNARRDIGTGLGTAEAGLRLRYEITRRFAPYIGIEREHAFGRTADYRREAGQGDGEDRLVAGVRLWF